MAGTYTKRDFGLGPEEQTLLKAETNGGTRILPSKEYRSHLRYNTFDDDGTEPVRLSPGWEGTGRTEDELNFKGVNMDLELNPPKDRLNIVLFIMLLHGIGALTPWNMFITANDYFTKYKLNETLLEPNGTRYDHHYLKSVGWSAQIPNLIFNWLNIFLPLAGNLTTRIVWGIFVQVIIFVETVVLAMVDSSSWAPTFFWVTMVSVVILNTSNGIYQNSVFGMAAKLPGKYTGIVVLGSNLSGVLTSIINILTILFAPNLRTSAIYYFITALFVLLACFDTYFALPINRFYRYHEYLFEKEARKKKLELNSRAASTRPPLWTVFKQCALQCFNVWFVFFVTLSLFPEVQANISASNPDFVVPKKIYGSVMCFLTFNVTAMLGSFMASLYQWPSKNFVIVPILLRAAFIPLFLLCNYVPAGTVRTSVYINDDWHFLAIGIAMGITSGYFSSVTMMYCSTTVEPQYASTAGMFGAAFLVTGVFSGITFSMAMPWLVTFLGFANPVIQH